MISHALHPGQPLTEHHDLPEILAKATSKTLEIPDEQLNQQVVETIYREVEHGMRPKDVAHLLKQRLKSNNPHKQWLAVCLMAKVLPDCATMFVGHDLEGVLLTIARVMVHPAKSDTHDGKLAEEAARDLLNHYGKDGAEAYRTAYIELIGETGAVNVVPHIPDPMNTGITDEVLHIIDPMNTGITDEHLHIPDPVNTGMTDEQPTLADPMNTGIREEEYEAPETTAKKLQADHDLHLLIPKAKEYCNVLNGKLSSGQAPDAALVTEVRELRGMLGIYLADLQQLSGEEVEKLILEALEAADLMDNTLKKLG